MKLFWQKGYEATGLSELLERMGIGRQSLYNTFGDKRALFEESLNHYVATRIAGIASLLHESESAMEGLHGVLKMYERHNTEGNGLGCLLVNSAAESNVLETQTREVLRAHFEKLETHFRKALERAKREGELIATAEPRALARSLVSTAFSTTLMGRAALPKPVVSDVIRMARCLLDSYAQD